MGEIVFFSFFNLESLLQGFVFWGQQKDEWEGAVIATYKVSKFHFLLKAGRDKRLFTEYSGDSESEAAPCLPSHRTREEPVGRHTHFPKASANILLARTGHMALPLSEMDWEALALAGWLPSQPLLFAFLWIASCHLHPVLFHHPRPFIAATSLWHPEKQRAWLVT